MAVIIENPDKERITTIIGDEDPKEFAIEEEKAKIDVEELPYGPTEETATGLNDKEKDNDNNKAVEEAKKELDAKELAGEAKENKIERGSIDNQPNQASEKVETEEELKAKLDGQELEDKKNVMEVRTLFVGSDEKGKFNAQVLVDQNYKIPVPEVIQQGLNSRENNIKTIDELAIDMEQNVADELLDRNSDNVAKSSKGKIDKPANPNWNNVVKMPNGDFEVYPPNPSGKIDNNAKWTITREQATKHGISEDGLDLVTKSAEELNEIIGLEKDTTRSHGINPEIHQSPEQGNMDISDR